jgi:hypothetical protein
MALGGTSNNRHCCVTPFWKTRFLSQRKKKLPGSSNNNEWEIVEVHQETLLAASIAGRRRSPYRAVGHGRNGDRANP